MTPTFTTYTFLWFFYWKWREMLVNCAVLVNVLCVKNCSLNLKDFMIIQNLYRLNHWNKKSIYIRKILMIALLGFVYVNEIFRITFSSGPYFAMCSDRAIDRLNSSWLPWPLAVFQRTNAFKSVFRAEHCWAR